MVILALVLAVCPLAQTAGWGSVCPDRSWPCPAKGYWQADFTRGIEEICVEKREGAEGTVTVLKNGIRIDKTNDAGYILVFSKTRFTVPDGAKIRAFSNVREMSGDPYRALGMLRVWGKKEDLTGWADAAFGPKPFMDYLINAEPGGTLRKFAVYSSAGAGWGGKTDLHGPLTAGIVIAGAPSSSVWSDWGVEDATEACRTWERHCAEIRKRTKDHSDEIVSESLFDAGLAVEVDHTARIERRDGVSRLIMDGRVALPVVYKGLGVRRLFCGRRMEEKADLKFQEVVIGLGRRLDFPDGCYWTPKGFDAQAAVAELKRQMRASPNSVFILGLSVNPYPEFADEHPEERWIGPDGKPVWGAGCHVLSDQGRASTDPKAWQWISPSSQLWAEGAEKCISELIGELKRTGLSRRIVGVHFSGSHDGQFAMPILDYSEPSLREFRTFLKDRYGTVAALSKAWNRPVGDFDSIRAPDFSRYGNWPDGKDFFTDSSDRDLVDFQEFMHVASAPLQERLARHAKKCFGKDIIAVKWCMGVHSGSPNSEYDFNRLVRSDAIDVFVAQSAYDRRQPGLVLPEFRFPASLHANGKLYMNELDFETYMRGFGSSEIAAMSRGYMQDYPMFESSHRKHAGQMFALRHGFWYYDMAGAVYDDDRQLADIRSTLETGRELLVARPSRWKPSAAFVVDEEKMFLRNITGRGTLVDENDMVREQAGQLARSGVPYDHWLMEDFLGEHRYATQYKIIVFCGMYEIDARRLALIDALTKSGVTMVFGSGTGMVGGANSIGFDLSIRPRFTSGHEILPERGYSNEEVKGYFETEAQRVSIGARPNSFKYAIRRPHRVSVSASDGVVPVARYVEDGALAIASRCFAGSRFIYVCDQMGLTPYLFNRLAKESGGYVCCEAGKVQVDMNGDFMSVHCLQSGEYVFRLPFEAKVVNLKDGKVDWTEKGSFRAALNACGTYWFRLFNARQ